MKEQNKRDKAAEQKRPPAPFDQIQQGHSTKWKKYSILLTSVLVCVLTISTCLLIYNYDNKYTAQGPRGYDGKLILPEGTFEEVPVIFLIDGWEYYNGRLLTPQMMKENPPLPDRHMFIGQFGGFEVGSPDGSPHGSASYRLCIEIPDDLRTYMLELPEIFSAYQLYVNGKLAAQMGNPDLENYEPETGNQTITIKARTQIELIFAVSDYTHFYSGMVYPPAFGYPHAISGLLNARLVFRSLLCAVALTIGTLSALIGLLTRRNTLSFLYSLLCLCFVGYVSYPITRTLSSGFQLQYLIERISFCAMLLIVLMASGKICGLNRKWRMPMICFGVLMCLFSALLHLFLPAGNLSLMLAYSTLISFYKWSTAAFLTIVALHTLLRSSLQVSPMLYGLLILDCTLVMDRQLPLHEPMLTGWFIELASFGLVLFIGVVIGQEISAQYRNSAVLGERAHSMERLYHIQQTYFSTLKLEMEETKRAQHDLRHHFNMIDALVQQKQYDQLSAYVAEYSSASAHGQVPQYCPIDVINVLSHHYHLLALQHQIHLDIRYDLKWGKPQVNMSDADLCSLYSNLMENALEACLRLTAEEKKIRVAIVRPEQNLLLICVWNTAQTPPPSGSFPFPSSKADGRQGYGLLSIRSIAEKYGGSTDVQWHPEKSEWEIRTLLKV